MFTTSQMTTLFRGGMAPDSLEEFASL